MNHCKLHRIASSLIFFILLLATSTQVYAQGGEYVYVTRPANGETVSGIAIITGAADYANFEKYEIFLKSGQNLSWIATGFAPVNNGYLARWDTRNYQPGTYQLVIRKVRTNSNYGDDYIGPTVVIAEQTSNALPVESGFLYAIEGKALVRLRNCAPQDLDFNYSSSQSFYTQDNISLPAMKMDDFLCSYHDFVLIPDIYTGAAKGLAEPHTYHYELNAEPGKVYQITYYGWEETQKQQTMYASGGEFNEQYEYQRIELEIKEISPDVRANTDTAGMRTAIQVTPQLSPKSIVSSSTTLSPTLTSFLATLSSTLTSPSATPIMLPTSSTSEIQSQQPLLPITGQHVEISSSDRFELFGIGFIIMLIISGISSYSKKHR